MTSSWINLSRVTGLDCLPAVNDSAVDRALKRSKTYNGSELMMTPLLIVLQKLHSTELYTSSTLAQETNSIQSVEFWSISKSDFRRSLEASLSNFLSQTVTCEPVTGYS